MSYDLYDDDRGYAGGSYDDGGGMGYRDTYASGLDTMDAAGGFADVLGLNNLSLNTDLDGYNSYGSGLSGGSHLYDDPLALDSGVGLDDAGLGSGGYLGGGALDAFDTLGTAGTGLHDSYDSGLGAYEGSRSLDAGLSGLDTLGAAGLGAYDTYGAGAGGLDTYGSLDGGLGTSALPVSYDAGLSAGLTGLDGYDSLKGLGGGLNSLDSYGAGLDSFGISGLDYAGAGESLGWNTYDSGFNDLGGLGGGLSSLSGNDYLEDAALVAGGAALGAGVAALYNSRSHHGDSYDNYGLTGSSALYGDTLYDRDLGVYGHSSLGYGAYSGFNSSSGLYDQTLAYSDLANYQNSLYANSSLSELERDRLLQDRYAFDALDDAARHSAWQSYSPGHRSRLGLDTGYWGSTYGNSYYDPQYSAWGYGAGFGPSYYGADYSYGYGDPSFYSTALTTPSWGLSSSLRARYSPYYSSTSSIDSLPYWSDDLRFREAADLSYYQQKLQSDRSLQEAERMMLWRQRQDWQALDEESRRLRWREMDELTRERLGLGQVGSWYGNYLGASGIGVGLPYELPSSLRSVYSPYMTSSYRSSKYLDPDYARYQDLLAWSNALKYDRQLKEAEKQARWRQRLEFEMLDDAARRARYQQMPYSQRGLLGLSGGYWASRLSFNNLLTPSNLKPMRYPVSTTLSRVFKPYQSKNALAQALKEGVESALAFADLVAFENALRADRRLREEDKLRRWKARVRWQEMSEMERRMRFYRMQESERRNIGLGLSSFFGRRYSAPIALNGTRGLPPPRAAMPMLRQPLPSPLRARYQSVLARQPNLATSSLSRSLVGQDRAKDLADRIKLSIAQKVEQMPGLSMDQRLASTEQKRQILRGMDNDRRTAAALQISEQERLNRLQRRGY